MQDDRQSIRQATAKKYGVSSERDLLLDAAAQMKADNVRWMMPTSHSTVTGRIRCPYCDSDKVIYAGYGGDNPRYQCNNQRCNQFGHVFT